MTNIKLSNTLLLTGYSNKHLIDDMPDHDTSSFQKGDQFKKVRYEMWLFN